MNKLAVFFKGAAMGVAEVIPGVSGGTIAFITGIYEKLLDTIKAFDLDLLKHIIKFDFRFIKKKLDLGFLGSLFSGMVIGLVVGVFAITYLLENYPVLIWGFFFGLILASVIYIGRQVGKWSPGRVIGLILGTIFAYLITIGQPVGGSESLLFVTFSGMLAISALMLPGISGSFILVLLGMYGYIIPQLKNVLTTFDIGSILVILCFGIGCLLGLALFSRSLSYAFNNYRDLTLATMCGIMLGSVNKIWPWRNPQKWLTEDGEILHINEFVLSEYEGKLKVLTENNVLPDHYHSDPLTILTILIALIGFGIVIYFDRFSRKEA